MKNRGKEFQNACIYSLAQNVGIVNGRSLCEESDYEAICWDVFEKAAGFVFE